MAIKKEIIVLGGGGHKGVVKVNGILGKDDAAHVSCSLDFRPTNAQLYLLGDTIAEIDIRDVHTESDVQFKLPESGDLGCVMRSSSLTMFGGSAAKSDMLSRVDSYIRDAKRARPENKRIAETYEVKSDARDPEPRVAADCAPRNISPLGEWTKYDGNNFYYAVKPQIDEMFVCYPTEKTLEETVQNSRFVRIDAEDGYYVVGLLYDGTEPTFICYGVPETESAHHCSPSELEGMCVWLPLGKDGISGYWMIYQSAKTGEIIK